jgi:hypothetical protein
MRKRDVKKLLCGMMAAALIFAGGCGQNSAATSEATSYGARAANAGATKAAPAMADTATLGNSAVEEAYDDVYEEYEAEADYYDETGGESGSSAETITESAQSTKRKLIRTVGLDVETQEFDLLKENIEAKVKELGGYIENSNIYNGSLKYDYEIGAYTSSGLRHANMTIRIPADKLDTFVNNIAENSNIVNKSETTRDVTLDYVDIDSKKKALQAEEKRLLEMLETADTIDNMIYIEERLTNVRYQIESSESQLRTYDNQVDYSTVSLNLNEVKILTDVPADPLTEPTAWERISKGFTNSVNDVLDGLENFFIGFIIASPYLILWAVIIGIIVLIFTLFIKGLIKADAKKREKNRKKFEAQQAARAAEDKAEKEKREAAAKEAASKEVASKEVASKEVASKEAGTKAEEKQAAENKAASDKEK